MSEKKTVGILFSGGLDSTYLVYKNLKEGNDVVPIYCSILNNEEKTKAEKIAIENLNKLFLEELDLFNFGRFYFKSINEIVRVDVINSMVLFSIEKNPQVPILIFTLLESVRKNITEFQIGYVRDDKKTSKDIKEFKNAYNSFGFVFNHALPVLKFPLLKISKIDIFNSMLPDEYLKHVTFCEEPVLINGEYVPCGDCGSCETYQKLGLFDDYLKIRKGEDKKELFLENS